MDQMLFSLLSIFKDSNDKFLIFHQQQPQDLKPRQDQEAATPILVAHIQSARWLVLVRFVIANLDTLENHPNVDPSVLWVQNVLWILLVSTKSVLILVLEFVELGPCVMSTITTPSVLVLPAIGEVHSFVAKKYQVSKCSIQFCTSYFLHSLRHVTYAPTLLFECKVTKWIKITKCKTTHYIK